MLLKDRLHQVKECLSGIAADYQPVTFANSFGAEDMVLVDLICTEKLPIEIFTLDTGRWPEETHVLLEDTRRRYGCEINVYFPDTTAMEDFARANGSNSFCDGIDQRRACCRVRKVEPLRRALTGKAGWITGLRREQTPTRQALAISEWDKANGLPKFNPLTDWTNDEVWTYICKFDVPYNTLHDEGYPKIGCAPCTRAIKAGEDIRASRWWWENPEEKECSLHPGKVA